MPSSGSPASWILLAFLIVLFLTGAFFGLLFYLTRRAFHVIFDRPFPRPAYDRSPMEIKQDTIYGRGQNWFYTNRLDFQDLQITSYDGLELYAYYRPAEKKETRFMVVLIHGWSDTPSSMAAFAQLYMEKTDCHILIPHMRAHGMSQGKYIGYGLSDSQDILMWTEYMEKHLAGPLVVLYHGWSMGAATALLAGGSGHLPPSVVGLIADSSYDNFKNQLCHNIRSRYRFAPGILLSGISRFAQKELGYTPHQISPIARAGRIEVPVLLIHGTSDTFVPTYMSEKIYEKIQSPKRILLVQDAEHIMSFDVAPSTYSSEVDQFLKVCKIELA